MLSKSQFRFVKNRSSLSQLLISYTEIQFPRQHLSPDIVCLDFSKAFDSIPHAEILYTLWLMGITRPLWCWLRDHLTNRRHFVEVAGVQSDMLPVRSGVPKGSILGPLLFIVYVNDIPSLSSFSSVYLYADDKKLIKSIHSLEGCSHLQDDFDALHGANIGNSL